MQLAKSFRQRLNLVRRSAGAVCDSNRDSSTGDVQSEQPRQVRGVALSLDDNDGSRHVEVLKVVSEHTELQLVQFSNRLHLPCAYDRSVFLDDEVVRERSVIKEEVRVGDDEDLLELREVLLARPLVVQRAR